MQTNKFLFKFVAFYILSRIFLFSIRTTTPPLLFSNFYKTKWNKCGNKMVQTVVAMAGGDSLSRRRCNFVKRLAVVKSEWVSTKETNVTVPVIGYAFWIAFNLIYGVLEFKCVSRDAARERLCNRQIGLVRLSLQVSRFTLVTELGRSLPWSLLSILLGSGLDRKKIFRLI